MSTNSRLSVAIHALVLLDDPQEERMTSEYIAGSVSTNPVVIRRLLAQLMNADLVVATKGAGGGYRLARPADRITLWDIYQALRDDGPFGLHRRPPNARCPVGRNIERHLSRLYDDAEDSMKTVLGATNLRALRRRVVGNS